MANLLRAVQRVSETAILNGIIYDVLAEAPLGQQAQAQDVRCRRLVLLRRPQGRREVLAKDYGPHPVYGDNRRYVKLTP